MTEEHTEEIVAAVQESASGLQELGDYTILRSLGTGSLGQTFLAEHRFLRQPVVLKVLADEWVNTPGFVDRFQEEVQLLGRLDGPNIVRVHNVSCADGHYFLVTDAIVDDSGEAKNLFQALSARETPPSEDYVYDVLSRIADALDAAHQTTVGKRSAVHGALKPSNILVNGDEVFVGDFGLSRMVSGVHALSRTLGVVLESLRRGGQSEMTQEWQRSCLETFSFLAPEQRDPARLDTVGPEADRYAFGVLAYWLLTLKLPEGCFPLPSKVRPELKDSWDLCIQRCMHPEPSKRPQSLVEVLKDVKASSAPAVEAVEEAPERSSGPQPVIHLRRLERPEEDLHPEKAFEVDPVVKVYHPQARELPEVDPLETEMVILEGGVFTRGSGDGKRDEMPCHQITLRSFALDVHPVTNEQFVRFLEVMGGEKDNFHRDLIRLRESRIKRSGGKVSIESGYHKHPVVGVTWYGASAYAQWVGKRLPTEAEWEIAAAGGDKRWAFPTGETIDKSQANFFSADTAPIKKYPANELGLYDVAGNVYEWCLDWYDYNYYERSVQEPDNPQGPVQGVYRVLRGGCWKSLKEDLRCSRRHRNNPGTANGTYGFRCAADVE